MTLYVVLLNGNCAIVNVNDLRISSTISALKKAGLYSSFAIAYAAQKNGKFCHTLNSRIYNYSSPLYAVFMQFLPNSAKNRTCNDCVNLVIKNCQK